MRRNDGCSFVVTSAAARMVMALLVAGVMLLATAGPCAAQGSRKDDIVIGARGLPLAGAQVRVCTASATTTSPCTPQANIYSDIALTQALANPTTTDGLGNYNFYAAPGRYVIEVSGPGITTKQIRDVILPSDPSQPADFSGDAISALSLTLAGNLTVAGSTAVTGTLSVGGAPVPSTAAANTWTAAQTFNAAVTLGNTGGNVAQKSIAADGERYVSPNGNDANDGLSAGTAMATVYHALCSLPGGNCSAQTAGSGTLHVANATAIGGPVAGQGIWVMGSSDPNYSSPPSGWLKAGGPVTIACAAPQPTALANQPGNTCGISGANSGTGPGGPFIWLSGNLTNYTFQNVGTHDYPNICIRLGVDSNGNRANGLGGSQLDVFDHFGCHIQTSNTSAGPGVDIGDNVFWIWFTHASLPGNSNATGGLSSDQNAAVVVNPSTGGGSGLLFFLDDVMNSGGIKYTPGAGSAGITVQHLTTEAIVKAAVWFTASNQYMTSSVDYVIVADCTGTCPAVENDGGEGAAVRVSNLQGQGVNSVGPVMNSGGDYPANYQNVTTSPTAQGSLGFWGNRVVGQVDASRRQFGPVSVRFPNIAATATASWSVKSGAALAQSIAAPDGTSGAGRVSVASGASGVEFFRQNIAAAVGDIFVLGVWSRSNTANGYASGNPGNFFFNSSGFTCAGGSQIVFLNQWITGDGDWQFNIASCTVATIGSGNVDTGFDGAADSTHTIDFYAPVLLHIPTGMVSASEAAEIAENLQTYTNAASAGQLASIQGVVPVGNPVRKLVFPWAACNGGTAASLWSPAAGNTGPGAACTSDNQAGYLGLKDGDTFYFNFTLPEDYVAVNSVTPSFVADDSTSGHSVVISAAAYCVAPNTNSAVATSPTFLTAGTATTTIPSSAAADVMYGASVTNLSLAGCTPGSYVRVKFSRGTDTATGNVYLFGGLVFAYSAAYGQ